MLMDIKLVSSMLLTWVKPKLFASSDIDVFSHSFRNEGQDTELREIF